MIEKKIKSIIEHYGLWRTVQIVLGGLSVTLLVIAIIQLLIPVRASQVDQEMDRVSWIEESGTILVGLNESSDESKDVIAYRSGMFKPATGLQDKPIADKTIERIKDQLKLQCILNINGQPVAYINIQEIGLEKCCVGDQVNDLFTVLDINEQNKSVDISIVEHKITLYL